MVFVSYPPAIKVVAVRMSLNGSNLHNICSTLGYTVSRQSINRWRELFEKTKSVIRNPDEYEQQGRIKKLSSEESSFMIQLLKDEPGLFLDEIRDKLYDGTGVLLSIQAVHDNLVNQLSITLKKAETLNIKKCLLKKFQYIDEMHYYPAEFLVFTDESAVCDRDLLRGYSRSVRGSPSARYIIRQNAERLSILPAIGMLGVLALTVREDTFNAKKFEHFLKWDLIPRMSPYPGPNSILVCDNAKIHKGRRVRKICDDAGIRVIYLPPYCPELNPIELCFAAMKQRLRRTQVLSYTTNPLWEIRSTFTEVITAEICYSNYRHCGYNMPPMSL